MKLFCLVALSLGLYVTSPWLISIIMGAIFAALFFPLMPWLKKAKLSDSTAGGVLTALMTVVGIGPFFTLILLGSKAVLVEIQILKDSPIFQSNDFIGAITELSWVQRSLGWVSQSLGVDPTEIFVQVQEHWKEVGVMAADFVGGAITRVPSASLGLLITLITTYYFLADGNRILLWLERSAAKAGVMTKGQTQILQAKSAALCRSVIFASLISGAVQSLLYSIAYLIVGGPKAGLTAFLIFVFSFIPLIGSMPITLGIALYQLWYVSTGAGVALLIMAAVVGVADNIVRPWVIKGAANLHPLLSLIGVFGGMKVFGFMGIFIGPIVLGIASSIFSIFLGDYGSSES